MDSGLKSRNDQNFNEISSDEKKHLPAPSVTSESKPEQSHREESYNNNNDHQKESNSPRQIIPINIDKIEESDISKENDKGIPREDDKEKGHDAQRKRPRTITISSNDDEDESSSSESSSSSSDDSEDSETQPPDGGWGWVVVGAAFLINLIGDGVTFSFGIIYEKFLEYFGLTFGTTAWIGSIFMSVPLLSGPLASFLTDRFGCRRVTIAGALLASSGFIISSQTNSFAVLCITFGLLAGFGLSLCYVASVVIVAYYFDKKRSLATGLAVCGSGIGTFIFPPLLEELLFQYNWRGTTLILAGFFLNLAICGALMRGLPWTREKQKSLAKQRKRKRQFKRKRKRFIEKSFSDCDHSSGKITNMQSMQNEEGNNEKNLNRVSTSLVHLPTYVQNREKVPMEAIELLSQHKGSSYNVFMANTSNSSENMAKREISHINNKRNEKKTANARYLSAPGDTIAKSPSYSLVFRRKKSIPKRQPPNSYLQNLKVHRLSVTYKGAMLNIKKYKLKGSSCPDIYRNSMTTIAKEKLEPNSILWDLWDVLVDMFDFSHFKNLNFLLFTISNIFLYLWYDIPYVYLKLYAVDRNHPSSDASSLISVIGIASMIGEIVLGWLGDRPWADSSIIYAACMGFCGAALALVPSTSNYLVLCALCVCFGFTIAANYGLTCVILVEVISLDRFTNAYGLLLLMQGVGNLLGPPLGGWLKDLTRTYDLSFYLAGVFISMSGFMLFVLPLTKRYKKMMKKVSETSLNESSFQNGKTMQNGENVV